VPAPDKQHLQFALYSIKNNSSTVTDSRSYLVTSYLSTSALLLLRHLSFYFTPLFKRLLPDLLVMGRREDKLRYLLRLLLPPQAWLQDYYQLSDTPKIAVHYLLHPLKLTYHYLVEVATAVF
jgi:hypothetical protein